MTFGATKEDLFKDDKQDRHAPMATVLMSVYNGQMFLREAIESILDQTFRDFEFLIINDGSSDQCSEIILSYKDSRIRLIENQYNIGLTRSLNKGLYLSKGKLIARQDADDRSRPVRLEKQISYMESHRDVVLLGAQANYINEYGSTHHSRGSEKFQSETGIKWQLIFDNPFIHSAVIFRRDIIWGALGGYNEDFVSNQDFELWSRVVPKYKTKNLSEYLIDLRVSSRSLSSNYKLDNIEKIKSVYVNNAKMYLNNELHAVKWANLWTKLNNPKIYGKITQPRNVFIFLGFIKSEFCLVNSVDPASQKCLDDYLAYQIIKISMNLARTDRFSSALFFLYSFRFNLKYPFIFLLRFIFHFLFGSKIKYLSNIYNKFQELLSISVSKEIRRRLSVRMFLFFLH